MSSLKPKSNCASCAYFQNSPAALEKMFAGLNVMSSGFASVRDEDGICERHGLYLSAQDSCPDFKPKWIDGTSASVARSESTAGS